MIPKITPTFEADRSVIAVGLNDGVGAGTTELHIIRPYPGTDPRYVKYLVSSRPFLLGGEAEMIGVAGQKRVPDSWLRNVRVHVTTKAGQAAIADFLDIETARIDSLITKKRQMVELLVKKRAAQISQILWHDATYDRVRVRHLAGRPTSGNRDHGALTFTSAGIPCLRGLNIRPARIDRQNLLCIDEASNHIHSNTILRFDDLVIVRSGFAGSAALVPHDLDGCNCVDLVLVRKSPTLMPRYLEYVVNSDRAQEQVRQTTSGALLSHFNAVDAGDLIIPYRELRQQERIAVQLDSTCSKIDRTVDLIQAEIVLLQEHRRALITAAVTGEMDVPGVST
ncbi:MAG: hypothetical protein ACRDQU_03440 [Pseudonocardiaceae bacterium]